MQLGPKEPHSRVAVVIDDVFSRWIGDQTLPNSLTSEKEAFEQLSRYAIGQYLGTLGMLPFTPSGTPAVEINANHTLQALFEQTRYKPGRPQASDDDVFAYATAKIYWGWRFGLAQVRFSLADHLRLAVPSGEIAWVALAGDGIYWTRLGSISPDFSPTSQLMRDFPAGRVPGLERSPVIQMQAKLGARRYEAAAEHFSKAMDFLTGPNQDLANSAKEATLAVESLAMLVTGRNMGEIRAAVCQGTFFQQ